MCLKSEVDAGAFFALLRFRAREREAKRRARKREEKRAQKKAKAPSAKEKSANSRFFLPPTMETRFQSPKTSCLFWLSNLVQAIPSCLFCPVCPVLPVLFF
jgi:hypothetical protein